MTELDDSIRDRFVAFYKSKGLKIGPWAKTAGVAEGGLYNYLSGRTASLTYSTLKKLANAAGVTVAEMLGEQVLQRKLSDFVAIKHLKVTASAGGGFSVGQEPESDPFYFQKSWLEQNIGDHDGKLRIIRFSGDSMLPTIRDGDLGLILIGSEMEAFKSGQIYVLWDGRGLVVKRLEAIIGKTPMLRVISDNKTLYSPYDVAAEDVHIVGRVLWRAGNL